MDTGKKTIGFAVLVFTIVTSVFIIDCGRQQKELENHKTIIRHVIEEAWNKGNLAVLDEVFSADFICHQIPYKDRNLESYKKLWTWFRSVYPDTKCDINSMVAEGDKVTVFATYNGTNKETGKHITGPGLILFRWKDGKIVESWDIWDELGYHQQLGYKMTPPITETTFALVTVVQLKPENMEEALKIYKDSCVPVMKSQKGFRSIYLMSDPPKTGKFYGISIWNSETDATAALQSDGYKAYADRVKNFFKVKPVREGYIVTVQE